MTCTWIILLIKKCYCVIKKHDMFQENKYNLTELINWSNIYIYIYIFFFNLLFLYDSFGTNRLIYRFIYVFWVKLKNYINNHGCNVITISPQTTYVNTVMGYVFEKYGKNIITARVQRCDEILLGDVFGRQ